MISCMGDGPEHNGKGSFILIDGQTFKVKGTYGKGSADDAPFGYDFWYQPRHNIMVSSEWAAPNTFMPGFDLEEVGHLKYGRELHFWDFEKKKPIESFYLGEDGLLPLEVKFHHNRLQKQHIGFDMIGSNKTCAPFK